MRDEIMIAPLDTTAIYECFGTIGQGSVSKVYDGYDHVLKRDVAIKELRPELRSDEDVVAAFWSEATLLAGLNHANILRVYGIDRQRHWIVMEPMQGSLVSEGSAAKLPPGRVREILRQVLEGLRYLHAMDRIHGQIRLDSLLVDEQGNVKLSNLSEVDVDGEFRCPDSKQLHSAPEVLNPRHFGQPGLTTDLYCVGIVALQLLAGDKFIKLFKGMDRKRQQDPVAWSAWHASSEAIGPIESVLSDLPADLIALLEGLTQKQVGLRFATAAEALGAITPTLSTNSNAHKTPTDSGISTPKPENEIASDVPVTYNSPSLFSPRPAATVNKPVFQWRNWLQNARNRFAKLYQRQLLLAAGGSLAGCLALFVSLASRDTGQDTPETIEKGPVGASTQNGDADKAREVSADIEPRPRIDHGSIRLLLTDDRKQSVDSSSLKLFINGVELEQPTQPTEMDEEVATDDTQAGWQPNRRLLDNPYWLTRAGQSAPLVLSGPVGTFDLEVRLNGFQTFVEALHLVANVEEFRRIELVRDVCEIQFRIQPTCAKLFIDDHEYAAGNSLRSVRLSWGKHHVKVSAGEHRDREQLIDVTGHGEYSIHLQPIPTHSITIDSYPQNALVSIDGTVVGRTPVEWAGIEGTHSIDLELNGFAKIADRFSATEKASRLLWYFDKEPKLLAQNRVAD